MGRAEKITVATFCIIALVCSALSIHAMVTLKAEGHPQFCIRALVARDLTLDIYVIVLSMVGLLYACTPERAQKAIKYIYSSMLVVLGLSFIVVGVVFFLILPLPYSTGLEGNPRWFRGGLVEGTAWTSFAKCMKGNKYCEKSSSIEVLSGKIDYKKNCCEAPPICGNGTIQEPPVVGGAKSGDCAKWNSSQNELCYGCDTCKEQVVETVKSTTFAFLPTVFFYGLIFMLGWFALA